MDLRLLIFERTRTVVEAERDLEKVLIDQRTIDKADKERADTIERLTADLKSARDHRAEIGSRKVHLEEVGKAQTCWRIVGKGKRAQRVPYSCNSAAQDDTAKGNRAVQEEHAISLKTATEQVADAEKRLADAEAVKVDDKATTKAVDAAKQKVADARAMNPMFRVAAAWQKIPVQKLSSEDFEQVKHWAVIGLAVATAFTTTLAAIISSMPERGKGSSKLGRSLRA